MRASVVWGIGVAAMGLVTGCALAHERGQDAGPFEHPDGAPLGRCDVVPPPTAACSSSGAPHICSDVVVPPVCVDGAWTCPPGTITRSECWCSALDPRRGRCDCSPSGWLCPTDPPDAGAPDVGSFPCPADPSTLAGTSCAVEGQSCGSCANPCSGPCDEVTCIGGTWQGLDFGCADPLFACGPDAWCARGSEYCRHVLSDVAGQPDDFRCAPFPEDCASDCSCFGGVGSSCRDDGTRGITVTLGGA